jgi:hypothetical protein
MKKDRVADQALVNLGEALNALRKEMLTPA